MKYIIECQHCHKNFQTKSHRAKYCSWLCKKIEYTKQQFPEGSSYIECQICGLRGRELIRHIKTVHALTVSEYCMRFNVKKPDLQTKDLHEQRVATTKRLCLEGRNGFVKGKYNPSQSDACKSGRNSVWSMNFKGYDGLSDEEKLAKIHALSKTAQQSRDNRHNNITRMDYYTSRGYSEQDAMLMLKKRQSTFTLEKCIVKYGEDEGRRIHAERQKKWRSTLNAKPIEEIERINKLKLKNTGYSKISQQLFHSIFEVIRNEYKFIFFATNADQKKFNEYMVHNPQTGKNYFLDFYVQDNNRVIEFDGDYWHGEKRGNQKRDMLREEELMQLGFTDICHVKERDYRNDPVGTVQKCVRFIREGRVSVD